MNISQKLTIFLGTNSFNSIANDILSYKDNSVYLTDFINGINYIDLSYTDPTKLSYIKEKDIGKFIHYGNIQKLKISTKLLKDIAPNLKFKSKYVIATIISINEYSLIVSVRKKGKKYEKAIYKAKLNKDTVQNIESYTFGFYNETFRRKFAIMTSPAKVINKIYTRNYFNQKEVDSFSRLFVKSTAKFKLVNGLDISYYYHKDQYNHEDRGTLGESCMKHNSCQNYFSIYEENDVSLLISLLSNSQIDGRALVWKNIYFPYLKEKKTFMDRIYTNNSSHEQIFINYAIHRDWVYKEFQTFKNKIEFIYQGNSFRDNISFTLKKYDFEQYPYIDTFTTGDFPVISNYGVGINFIEIDGEYNEETEEVYCEHTDSYHAPGDTVYSDFHNSNLPSDEAFYVVNDWYHDSDIDEIIALCKSCNCISLINELHHSNIDDCWYCKRHCVYSKYEIDFLDTKNATCYNNEYYLKDKCCYSCYHKQAIPEHLCAHVTELNDFILIEEVEKVLKKMTNSDEEEIKERVKLILNFK